MRESWRRERVRKEALLTQNGKRNLTVFLREVRRYILLFVVVFFVVRRALHAFLSYALGAIYQNLQFSIFCVLAVLTLTYSSEKHILLCAGDRQQET